MDLEVVDQYHSYMVICYPLLTWVHCCWHIQRVPIAALNKRVYIVPQIFFQSKISTLCLIICLKR
jgi:hypothetical protein